jgi:hypothetical protein
MAWAPAITAAAPSIGYDGAGPWNGGAACTGFSRGARALGRFILARFPGVTHVGGYDCRPNTANASLLSVHGTGRAIDVHFPGAADPRGTVLADWLVRNAAWIGVQAVIWDRTIWSSTRGAHPYLRGASHRDHVHVELTRDAALERTPFFTASPPPPPRPPSRAWLAAAALALAGTAAGAVWITRRGRR